MLTIHRQNTWKEIWVSPKHVRNSSHNHPYYRQNIPATCNIILYRQISTPRRLNTQPRYSCTSTRVYMSSPDSSKYQYVPFYMALTIEKCQVRTITLSILQECDHGENQAKLKVYRKTAISGVVALNLSVRAHPFSDKKYSPDQLSCFLLLASVLYCIHVRRIFGI